MENNSTYGKIRRRILRETASLPSEKRVIRGAWTLKIAFQPDAGERLFQYDVSIIQIEEQGAAYSFAGGADHETLKTFINRDAAGCLPEKPDAAGVAILDALCGSVKARPSSSVRIEGTSREKAVSRAGIISSEVKLIAERLKKPAARICNVGAIGNIVKALSEAGHTVSVTDLEQDIIGTDLHGSTVLDGSRHTLSAVAESDIAVVTGMTFANGALDEISSAAREAGTKIVLVAETGAWVGRRFIEEAGVETVISEPFPYYIFSGASTINVFRRSG